MEVKPGYKQTEVGVIPEDWRVDALGPHVDITSGESPSRFRFTGEGIPYFKVDQLNNNSKYLSDTPYLIQSSRKVSRGSLIFPKRGASILLNKVRILADDSFMDTNLMTLTPRASVNSEFLYYALTHIELWRIADTTSIPQINNKHILPLLVPFPPTKAEQEAIAEALSDADALIESLEQLLAKKRLLKQGAMQELLTGKKRLPGFEINPGYKQTEVGVIPEDWDTPELGDVLKSMQLGGNYKNSERETSWPLIKMGNLGRGSIKLAKLEFIDPSQPPTGRDRLRKDDVLFNTRNTLDLVGKVALWRDELPEAFFNSNIMRMEFNETRVSSKRFMNYILNTPQSLTRLRGIAIGTTSVAAIYGRDLVKMKVPLPTGTEQEAISEALNDMDAEIAALEAKLAKARQIKQGMMQELLTGRIRLV